MHICLKSHTGMGGVYEGLAAQAWGPEKWLPEPSEKNQADMKVPIILALKR